MLKLILAARSGDQEACNELIERMYDIIRMRCCKRGGGQLAEDAAQETAIIVLRKIRQFKGDSVAEFNAWLGMVCRSGVQRAVAKSVRPRERSASEEALAKLSFEDDLSRIDSKILVDDIRKTPLRDDVDLLLSVAGSKSQLAIATERNVGCRTLKTQVHRARERLRLHMCA